MATLERRETKPARLMLRNFKMQASQLRRWATQIEHGKAESVVRQMRARADELEISWNENNAHGA